MLGIPVMTDAHGNPLDLNLLRVLEALYQARSVTGAAEHLGITQSGASRALARLRHALGDPLFVSERGGLRPTPRAEELRATVLSTLSTLRSAFAPRAFDPAQEERPVRIGVPDHLAWLVGPTLLRALRDQAPQMPITLRGFSADWRRELDTGALDLAFGVLEGTEAHLRCRTVFEDSWSVIVREEHPCLDGPWTPETFAEGEHGLMTVTGSGPGHVDEGLAALGLRRTIALRASSPVVVALLATDTDLRVTTSTWLATMLAQRLPVVVRPLPLQAPPLPLPLVWHETQHADPRHRWVRELVAKAVARTATSQRP